MRISRLYVAQPLQLGEQLTLDEDASHYVRTVLRLKQDQAIVLFDGQGCDFVCHFTEVSRKTVRVLVNEKLSRDVESPLRITLGMGVSRGDRMDWAVQKAVELGVHALTPLITERCVIKFDADKKQQRRQHWQHIVQHAAEQSGRSVLPVLHDVAHINEWVGAQQGLKVFLDPYAEKTLADIQPDAMHLTLLSGPEGGFSDQEREQAKAAGFIPVKMGPRILRTETAVLAALAAAQSLWGDFR